MNYLLIGISIASFIFDTVLSTLNYKNRKSEIPDEVKDVYDEEAYDKWLKYDMENFRLSMITRTITFIIMITLLTFNVFVHIYNFAGQLTNDLTLQTLIFVGYTS